MLAILWCFCSFLIIKITLLCACKVKKNCFFWRVLIDIRFQKKCVAWARKTKNKNSSTRVTVQMDGDILCLKINTLQWTGHYLRSQWTYFSFWEQFFPHTKINQCTFREHMLLDLDKQKRPSSINKLRMWGFITVWILSAYLCKWRRDANAWHHQAECLR